MAVSSFFFPRAPLGTHTCSMSNEDTKQCRVFALAHVFASQLSACTCENCLNKKSLSNTYRTVSGTLLGGAAIASIYNL